MNTVFIGLGSNLSTPVEQLNRAVKALSLLPDSNLVNCSSYYSSSPMGPQDQPDYVNAVVEMKTNLPALALLERTQQIENEQGRVRKEHRWGPRTLDLDILLYGNEQINLPQLTVPHYGLCQREFVLYPLFELQPRLMLPDGRALKTLVENCPLNGLYKLTPS